MTGIDTNVLVRFLTNDDAAQSPLAQSLIDCFTSQKPGFISIIALVETVWVLADLYGHGRDGIALVVQNLLELEDINLQERDLIWRSLRLFLSSKADFSDCVVCLLGADSGCEVTVTFDRQAAKLPGFRLLSARKPQ